jgi:hypothetical protein
MTLPAVDRKFHAQTLEAGWPRNVDGDQRPSVASRPAPQARPRAEERKRRGRRVFAAAQRRRSKEHDGERYTPFAGQEISVSRW